VSEITRDEFDRLAGRVTALEAVTERTWAMIGHLDVSVREVHDKLTEHDARFAQIDARFDRVDARLDRIGDKLLNMQSAMLTGVGALETRHDTLLDSRNDDR
jgi:hypothetical protein